MVRNGFYPLPCSIVNDVRIDKLVLTDPDGRIFSVKPERNVLAAGMQPTYEFIVESGQNFAVGKYRLLMVGLDDGTEPKPESRSGAGGQMTPPNDIEPIKLSLNLPIAQQRPGTTG